LDGYADGGPSLQCSLNGLSVQCRSSKLAADTTYSQRL
jgi:hypothetical protein